MVQSIHNYTRRAILWSWFKTNWLILIVSKTLVMWIWLPKMLVDITIQDEFVSQVLCLRRQRMVQHNMNKWHHSLRQVFDGSVQDGYLQDVLLYVSLNYGCGYLLVYFVLPLASNELCVWCSSVESFPVLTLATSWTLWIFKYNKSY